MKTVLPLCQIGLFQKKRNFPVLFSFLIIHIFSLSLVLNATAQDGILDASFNGGGIRSTSGIYAIKVQTNKKILIGGNNTNYNGVTVNQLTRLNEDGSRDVTFNPSGSGVGGTLRDIHLQSNGKIIIAGSFTTYNGNATSNICRLNTDGTFDPTFSLGGAGFNGTIQEIAVLSNDKILVGGSFSTLNGVAVNRLVRLNSDGSLDASFLGGTRANSHVYALKVASDGKIVIGGNFSTYNGVTVNRIARLNADGSLDASFSGGGTRFNNEVFAVEIYTSGKIMAAGYFTTFNGLAQNRLIRLNSDGSRDATLNIGTGFNAQLNAITSFGGGVMLVAGAFTTYKGLVANRIIRILADGTIDPTWNPAGVAANNDIYTLTVQYDNKILVGGDQTTYNGTAWNRIIRLNNQYALLSTQINKFNIVQNGFQNQLNWSVTSTEATSEFIVEKSENGNLFERVASVQVSSNLSYSFTATNHAHIPVLYYRIKIIDKDASVKYSQILQVKINTPIAAIKINTYPNPVVNELMVSIPAEWQNKNVTYQIVSSNGQTVSMIETNKSNYSQRIQVSNLKPGTYIVLVSCDGQTANQKMLKQ